MVTMDTYGDLFETAWDKVEAALSESFRRGEAAAEEVSDAMVTELSR